jgi:uncharacterized membrane protein
MARILGIAFFALLVAGAVVIVVTSEALPLELASHFGRQGRANGWQPLASYRTWMLLFAIGVPCLTVAAMAWLPRRFPRLSNLPHRDHWLAPVRREATFAALAAFAFAIGIVEIAFALGIHLSVVAANATDPPTLPAHAFMALMACFVVAIVAVVIAYHLRFRRLQ